MEFINFFKKCNTSPNDLGREFIIVEKNRRKIGKYYEGKKCKRKLGGFFLKFRQKYGKEGKKRGNATTALPQP